MTTRTKIVSRAASVSWFRLGKSILNCFHATMKKASTNPSTRPRHYPIVSQKCGSHKCSARASNANGVLSQSPGLRRQALPWVTRSQISSTPTGLCLPRDRTPLGFSEISGVLPRVAARSSRQPWAGGRNAVGVPWDRHLSSGSNAEPTAPNS